MSSNGKSVIGPWSNMDPEFWVGKQHPAVSLPGLFPDAEALNFANANRENPKQVHGDAKVQLQLLSPAFKEEVAKVMSYGANKYGAWNWRDTQIKITTYIGAIQRHMDAFQDGQDVDEDSGLLHLAHAAACINVVLDARNQGCLINDRAGVFDDSLPPFALGDLGSDFDVELDGSEEAFPWNSVREISEQGFLYMLSPYTKFHLGQDEAAEQAAYAAGILLDEGITVHSPITETHAIAKSAGLPQKDHEFWLSRDLPFMKASEGAIVFLMDGWNESAGMAWEMEWFEDNGLPIFYLRPEDLPRM